METGTNEAHDQDVRQFLPWLIEMGADEVILDQPVNRMAEQLIAEQPAQPDSPTVARKPLPSFKAAPPPPLRPQLPESVAVETQSPDVLAASAASLEALQAAYEVFTSHPLKRTATRLCFLGGAERARVLLLCDKPRSEEDPTGEVLSGRHQVLAERMLAAIGLCGVAPRDASEQVALANFVPWRPPGNRSVTEAEARACVPFARRLLDLLKPQAILCFGSLPGQYLAGGDAAITRARGVWRELEGVPLLTTFHPETLLKSPQLKRLAWHDLLAFRAKLDSLT